MFSRFCYRSGRCRPTVPMRPITAAVSRQSAAPALSFTDSRFRSPPSTGSWSLDPSWISTIFGLIILIGEVAVGDVLRGGRRAHPFRLQTYVGNAEARLRPRPWQVDAGFIMVWAYFNFSQWLIIWAGNLPAEITFYLRRLKRRLGLHRFNSGVVPFRNPFRHAAFASFQRKYRKLVWVAVFFC